MFFFQAEDGIRDLVRSRGLGDVYKRQEVHERLPRCDASVQPAQPEHRTHCNGTPDRSDRYLSLIHI